MTRKKKAAGYEVGYRKPPKHTRFKAGRSGNPKGRPRGTKNLRSLLRGALFKKLTVTENGRARSMSRGEAIVTGLVAKALKGDVRATELVLKLMQQQFPTGEEPPAMRIFLQRFSDGEILGEIKPQADGRGAVESYAESDPWVHLRKLKGARSTDDDEPPGDSA